MWRTERERERETQRELNSITVEMKVQPSVMLSASLDKQCVCDKCVDWTRSERAGDVACVHSLGGAGALLTRMLCA